MPIGEPDVKQEGSDLTILTIGATLYRALEAAKTLQEEHGRSCEVIDARSIVPFKLREGDRFGKEDGRILLASDACEARELPADIGREDQPVNCFTIWMHPGRRRRAQLDNAGGMRSRTASSRSRRTSWMPCTKHIERSCPIHSEKSDRLTRTASTRELGI